MPPQFLFSLSLSKFQEDKYDSYHVLKFIVTRFYISPVLFLLKAGSLMHSVKCQKGKERSHTITTLFHILPYLNRESIPYVSISIFLSH